MPLLARIVHGAVFATAFLTGSTTAQKLVRDFSPGGFPNTATSFAQPAAPLPNGRVLFVFATPEFGTELWATDGTQAGSQIVLDIEPGLAGSSPESFRVLPGGTVLFLAQTSQFGKELWRTDGTAQGTSLVRDITPGSVSNWLRLLDVVGNDLLMIADDGITGPEIWRTDGTLTGTTMVADVHPATSPSSLGLSRANFAAIAGAQAVFPYRAANNAWQLWRTDLTTTGTVVVRNLLSQNSNAPGFSSFGSGALFHSGNELWITDGTAAGTATLSPARAARPFVDGTTAYFFHANGNLWRTDGTQTGTTEVYDLSAIGPFGYTRSFVSTAPGRPILFRAGTGAVPDLFVTDGTAAGTQRLTSIEISTGSLFTPNVALLGNQRIFTAITSSGASLWSCDGTISGTLEIAPVSGAEFVPFQGGLLFQGTDPTTGSELWFTDGTPAGTKLAVDLKRDLVPTSSTLSPIATFRDEALMLVRGADGADLWLSDGTPSGTRRVTNTQTTAAFQAAAASTGSKLITLIQSNSPSVAQLWAYDEASDSLQPIPIDSVHPTFAIGNSKLSALGDSVVFAAATDATGVEPWVTNGTLAGTRPLVDIAPGPANGTTGEYYAWRGRAYFRGLSGAGGYEPWVTDGTTAGTTQLVETTPSAGYLNAVEWQSAGDHLYLADLVTYDIWQLDGTPNSAVLIDLPAAGIISTQDLHASGDDLVFIASTGTGRGIVRCDTNTFSFQNLAPTLFALDITRLSNSQLLVRGTAGPSQEIWVTDGTVSGTQFVDNWQLTPNAQTATRVSDSRVLVSLDRPSGRELYSFDGTTTQLLFDLAPGDSNPNNWIRAGNKILFAADDGTTGNELYAFDLTLLQDSAVASFGFGCAGSGVLPPDLSVDGGASAGGATVDLAVEGALPNAVVLFGLADDHAALAMAGCHLWLGGNAFAIAAAADAQGRATTQLPVTPALFGLQLFAQGFAVDANGPLLGFLSATAGLEIVFGP
ncbi:MAG: hypothetical protein AB8H80_09920 [Planctomycetota bacterium]